MPKQSRETQLSAAFVAVADTLTANYDVVDLLHTLVSECAAILNVQAGGLMLTDSGGNLQLVASTSESADLVEVMQLAAGAGPCVDCFTTGMMVSVPDIAATGQKWPAFREAALSQRFLSVHATPMRLRGTVIGTMNLFGTEVGEVSRADAAVAQALADVATIGIIQERVTTHSHVVAEQLQRALDSRILIEQAKGALAQATAMTTDEAFNSLRSYARNHNLPLHAVAEGVTSRTIAIEAVLEKFSPTQTSR